MSAARQDTNAILRSLAQGIGDVLAKIGGGRRWGFALLIFPLGEETREANYISNCSREDMKIAIREWLARQEGAVSEGTQTRQ